MNNGHQGWVLAGLCVVLVLGVYLLLAGESMEARLSIDSGRVSDELSPTGQQLPGLEPSQLTASAPLSDVTSRTVELLDPDSQESESAELTSQLTITVRSIAGSVKGAPVPDAKVTMWNRGFEGGASAFTTDSKGRATVAISRPGWYRFEVEQDSLPAHLQAPGTRRARGSEILGITRPDRYIDPDRDSAIDLWCQERRSIRGVVVDADGAPIRGATARLTCPKLDRYSSSKDDRTGSSGSFVFTGLVPFEYELQVDLARSTVEGASSSTAKVALAAPPPMLVDLAIGSRNDLVLNAVQAKRNVSGRIIDEMGQPVPNLSLSLSYKRPFEVRRRWLSPCLEAADPIGTERTDAEGRFQFDAVADDPVYLLVDEGDVRHRRGSLRRLALQPEPMELSSPGGGSTSQEIGDWAIPLSRSYRVRGTVELTAEEVDGASLSLAMIKLSARFSQEVVRDAHRHGVLIEPYIDYNVRTGKFDLRCDGHNSTVIVEVRRRGRDQEVIREFRFQPQPDAEEQDKILSIP